jgi:hypothetical protein
MNKLVAIALVAVVATTASVGSASAFAFSQEFMDKIAALKNNRGGDVAEVGETFNPFVKVADVRETCEFEGGVAKRQFDASGNLVWVCIR